MDCPSCGAVNAPGRRYCRECGSRLGQACAVCQFFNATEDRHCGGCGRRLAPGVGPFAADDAAPRAVAPELTDSHEAGAVEDRAAAAIRAGGGIGGPGVSQSEIDGLFENILDEESGETAEGGP
jgi:hypothetical protein